MVIKQCFTLFFLLSIFHLSHSQEKKSLPFFFNEFHISVNRSALADANTENKFGFGAGISRLVMRQKKLNFIFGFEYNLNRQLKKQMYEGHFAFSDHSEYTINNLSIPLSLRYNLGNVTRLFLESGTFLDLSIGSQRKGSMHTFFPDQNNNIVYKEYTVKGKAGLAPLNYGLSGGVGLRLPFKKNELIIKTNYRFGWRNLYSGMGAIYNRYVTVSIGILV
jgi:hypothetical protein